MTGSPRSVAVHLKQLRRRFGPVQALDGLDIEMAPGELVALLGPSGCGKTTALRVLAGLEDADSGAVLVDGQDVTNVPANRRDMGMVFQAYSLFPHLTARQNVEFGLRLRGRSSGAGGNGDVAGGGNGGGNGGGGGGNGRGRREGGSAERAARAGAMLELVGISMHADRYPHQLSGGQQQRVALARALAIEPQVLLLDEPLSALDAKVRVQLRDEIRRIQIEVGTTTLFVTHDQEEALAMADRVGVMRDGRLEQLGPPSEIYLRPASPFVANFVGLSNRLPGRLVDGAVEVLGTRLPLLEPAAAGSLNTAAMVTAMVRPESIEVVPAPEGTGRVLAASFLGPTSRVTVAMGDLLVVAQIASHRLDELPAGTAVRVDLHPVPVALDGSDG